jgi:hypothetical protein
LTGPKTRAAYLYKAGVLREGLELLQLVQVGDPALADTFNDEVAQRDVALQQPAPRRDAVCLVLKLVGPQLVPVLKRLPLDDVGVDLGNALGLQTKLSTRKKHSDRGRGKGGRIVFFKIV